MERVYGLIKAKRHVRKKEHGFVRLHSERDSRTVLKVLIEEKSLAMLEFKSTRGVFAKDNRLLWCELKNTTGLVCLSARSPVIAGTRRGPRLGITCVWVETAPYVSLQL